MSANITIDIGNDPDIHSYFITAFHEMNWQLSSNAFKGNPSWHSYRNSTAKYFIIDIQEKAFSWFKDDDAPSFDEQKISSVLEAAELMAFIKENATTLRNPTPWEMFTLHNFESEFIMPSKIKMDAEYYKQMSKAAEKLKMVASQMDTPLMVSYQKHGLVSFSEKAFEYKHEKVLKKVKQNISFDKEMLSKDWEDMVISHKCT